jgi:metal-responsive CopG/Arc/MetJ family transcriptional regulator
MEPELVERVEQAATEQGVSASKLIRLAVIDYIERK